MLLCGTTSASGLDSMVGLAQCVFNKKTLYVILQAFTLPVNLFANTVGLVLATMSIYLHLEVKSATHGYIIRPT